jgi:hypothetical protein
MTNEDLKVHIGWLILQRLGAKVKSQDRKIPHFITYAYGNI